MNITPADKQIEELPDFEAKASNLDHILVQLDEVMARVRAEIGALRQKKHNDREAMVAYQHLEIATSYLIMIQSGVSMISPLQKIIVDTSAVDRVISDEEPIY